MPTPPLAELDVSRFRIAHVLTENRIPVLFGTAEVEIQPDSVRLGLDVLGSVFFMLSRYEELVSPDRDEHDRFPGSASVAYREGFLDRPIIDEYVEILWACMKMLWPNLERKPIVGKMFVTCDVDVPYDVTLSTPWKTTRRIAADLLKRRSLQEAKHSLRNAMARRRGDWTLDKNNTFDWMMNACEKWGHKMGFFFISDLSSSDSTQYRLSEPFIQDLLVKMDRRGHEIGLHGRYNTFRDPTRLRLERQVLQQTCERAGIKQSIEGNRQHYLQWDSAQTPACLEGAGIGYDTTGSFADAPGFRFGTSRSFHMWDWKNNRVSKVRQRPLIVMEQSVIDTHYPEHGWSELALKKMLELKHQSMKFGGEFVLLWHNSSLATEVARGMFEEVIHAQVRADCL